jgi:catechol 2,3-dioxygenase
LSNGEKATIHPEMGMGMVALVVANLARSLEYYQRSIGLQLLWQQGVQAGLGVSGQVLLVLQEQPGALPVQPGHSGLYHFALLMPSRHALAQVLRQLTVTRAPLGGASDHGVSEALYLSDPDGHGIEIYRDRPRTEWPFIDGKLAMMSDPLDLPAIIAELAPGETPETQMPSGTIMGHVHLHVNNLEAAERFYVHVLGFELMQRYGSQASFLATGGYHHHLGINTWAGVGAPPAPKEAARLLWVEIVLPDRQALHGTVARIEDSGHAVEEKADGWWLQDPSHNQLRLTTREI